MKLPLQLDEIRAQLEHAKLEAERVTAGLSEAQLWQPPPDGGWSVGECLAHLNIFGEGYALKLKPALQKARSRKGQGPFRLGLIGGFAVRAVAPDTKAKLKAPQSFQPEPQAGVLERFLALQDELLGIVRQAEGLALTRIIISSPASRFLRLSSFEALNAVTVHQLRHLAQAARVQEALETA